jgi:hypothetical protein
MYEINYKNDKRVVISMGQFHDWTLYFKDNTDDRFIQEHVERVSSQSCYGDITHHFHSQLDTLINSVCVRTFFDCQQHPVLDTECWFDRLQSYNFDSVWSMYTFEQITTLLSNIRNILRNQYHIEHSVQFYTHHKYCLNCNNEFGQLNCELVINGNSILPHELFFILNVYRRLFTLSNKITNDIVFQLTRNATNTWCDLDAVALLVLFDYFNTYSPNDSLIGYVYLKNLHSLKSFLDANSFSEFSTSVKTENKLINHGTFRYSDLFSAIVNKTDVNVIDGPYNINDYARIALNYELPSPFMFYNDQYNISLEEFLKPTVCTDEIAKQIETYIGFLKAVMYNNNK